MLQILFSLKKKKSLAVWKPRFELIPVFQICAFYYTSFEKLFTYSKPGIKRGFHYECQLWLTGNDHYFCFKNFMHNFKMGKVITEFQRDLW